MANDSKTNIQKTLASLKQNVKKSGAPSEAEIANLREGITGTESRISQLQKEKGELSKLGNLMEGSYKGTQNDIQRSVDVEKELRDLRSKLPGMQTSLADRQKQLTGSVQRERDVLKGAEFGASVLGEGLGRLGEDVEVSEALERFKGISETGLSSAESVAQREKAISGIDQATQTGLRGLQARLASAGVKGATAGQQLIQREAAGAQQKAEVERDLFLQSEQVKREGLKEYSSRLGDVKTFDLAQAASEKDILLQSGLGFAQLGSAERTAQFAAEKAKEASVSAAKAGRSSCFALGTSIEMHNGTLKRIENLNPGDILKGGDIVSGISRHLFEGNKMYSYDGVLVTGKHYVYEKGLWMKVEDSSAKETEYHNNYVYNLFTDSGTVIINHTLFSDYDGFASMEEIDKITLRRMNELVQTLPIREIR